MSQKNYARIKKILKRDKKEIIIASIILIIILLDVTAVLFFVGIYGGDLSGEGITCSSHGIVQEFFCDYREIQKGLLYFLLLQRKFWVIIPISVIVRKYKKRKKSNKY